MSIHTPQMIQDCHEDGDACMCMFDNLHPLNEDVTMDGADFHDEIAVTDFLLDIDEMPTPTLDEIKLDFDDSDDLWWKKMEHHFELPDQLCRVLPFKLQPPADLNSPLRLYPLQGRDCDWDEVTSRLKTVKPVFQYKFQDPSSGISFKF